MARIQLPNGTTQATYALVFKWIRIPHRCWLSHTPYNESR